MARKCCKPVPFPFTRWGLKFDPRGVHVVTPRGELYQVKYAYRREIPAAWMLAVSHLNGEPAPDIAASYVKILPRHYHGDEKIY